MKRTDYLLVFLVLAGCFQLLQCMVGSFYLASGGIPRLGETVQLICEVTGENVAIRKTIGKAYMAAVDWATCSKTSCLPVGNGYNLDRSDSSVTITINAVSRADDERWWTCVSSNALQLKLVVYTVPTSVSLEDAKPCDLAWSSCVYTCTTDNCTYPKPTFEWHYSKNNAATTERMFGSYDKPATEIADSCSNPEGLYKGKIEFPRYLTSPDRAIKTMKLKCMIQFPKLTDSLRSGFSGNVQFAVKVSNVTIYDGEVVLKTGYRLTVKEFEKKTLRCEADYGHPSPSLTWYIGQKNKSSDSTFSFIANNSIHGQDIYCKAFNIPGSEIDSVKAELYVKVKIKNVYIEPAWDSTLSVIENMAEPVVCYTSGGRPVSTIKWLESNSGKGLGPSDFVDYINTDERLIITKATKNVSVSRQDNGWILTCEAWNTDEFANIKANNSKTFNILYPPENMGILYADERVTGAVIDVVRGTNVTLKCAAEGNPTVESFSWSTRDQKPEGKILTIENITNNQTVQCTGKNIMNSTAGISKQGLGFISKEINVVYEATITRFTVIGRDNLENENNFTVNENAFLPIVCVVDSNPGSYINLKQSHKVLSERQSSRALEYNISSANCIHNSEYTCTAWNEIKTAVQIAERKIQINVICSPVLAEETDTTVFALQYKSTVLSVNVIAFPMPTYYQWFRNTSSGWQKVIDSSEIQITHTALQFNLTFRKVRKEDYGEYNLTVGNGIGHPSSFLLVLQAHEEAELQSDAADNGTTVGIIGGVVAGLLVVGTIIAVLYILRRRKSFDGMKECLFKRKSTASRRDMDQIGEGTQDAGYSYALVDNSKGQKEMNLIHKSNALADTTKQDDGPCYENPAMSDDSTMKDKPSKKTNKTKPSGKKQPAHSHDGLVYIDIHFEDKKSEANQKKKQNAVAKPKVSEQVVYDAVQFGVVGESYHEEK